MRVGVRVLIVRAFSDEYGQGLDWDSILRCDRVWLWVRNDLSRRHQEIGPNKSFSNNYSRILIIQFNY